MSFPSSLSAAQKTARLSHGGVLLLESLTETFGALEEFVNASHDATLFLGVDLCRGEIVDAVLKALLDQVGVHLSKI